MAWDLVRKKRTGRDFSISIGDDESGAAKTETEKKKERGIFVTIIGLGALTYFSMDKPSRLMQAAGAATMGTGLYMWTSEK